MGGHLDVAPSAAGAAPGICTTTTPREVPSAVKPCSAASAVRSPIICGPPGTAPLPTSFPRRGEAARQLRERPWDA